MRVLIDERHPWVHLNDQNCDVWVSGKAWDDGVLLRSSDLCQKILHRYPWNENDIKIWLHQLNGFFAIIYTDGASGWSAVDKVRSIPIFIAKEKGTTLFSNAAERIRSQLNLPLEFTSEEKLEFLHSGYVIGSRTLIQQILQLQAGEVVFLNDESMISSCKHVQYYNYLHIRNNNENQSVLAEQLRDIFNSVFERFIQMLDGRRCVVPLSGGWDSRLIVTMLKQKGYTNVLCYSYGNEDIREAEYSRQVACSLGYPWEFIQYSPNKWKEWMHSTWMRDYWCYAFNLSSLPHLQDAPAIYELCQKKILSKDDVITPGHTGDFLTGSQIPLDINKWKFVNKQQIIDAIIHKYFNLWSDSPFQDQLQERLTIQLQDYTINDVDDFVNYLEWWHWRGRGAKYIINSCRLYDFFGMDWWMPLWDSQLAEFFQMVPLSFRVGQKLYKETLTKYIFSNLTKTLPNIPISHNNVLPISNLESQVRREAHYLLDTIGLFDECKDMFENINKILGRKLSSHFLSFDHWFTNGYDPNEMTLNDVIDREIPNISPVALQLKKAYGKRKVSRINHMALFALVFLENQGSLNQ